MYRFPCLRAFSICIFGGIAAVSLFLSPVRAQVSVLTQNNDNARTGANTQETILTPFNVNTAKFGKLFTIGLDANVNGQVLYVPHLTLKGGVHNTLFAYTSYNTDNTPAGMFAFDADTGTQLWHTSLPNSATYTTPTPVIDPVSGTMYVLTKTGTDDTGATYLHAIDITTGLDKAGSPVQVQASAAGTGDGAVNGIVSFDGPASSGRFHANDRPGLLLLNGTVYLAFAHNSDSYPYHGWVLAYQYSSAHFTQTAKLCTTPNGGDGGIWMAGKGLTADASGYIYCTVGNGTFDADAGGKDYAMCVLKLRSADLSVADWFAPHDELAQSNQDLDTANVGVTLIPGTDRLFTGATKFGSAFLLESANLGGFTRNGPDNVLDRIDSVCGNDNVGQNAVAWDTGGYKYVYLWPSNKPVRQFRYDPAVGNFSPSGIFQAGTDSANVGGSLAISSNGGVNGILWTLSFDGVVRAYNAQNVSQAPLWTSEQNSSRDALGSQGHFEWPTVANGKVYVPNAEAGIAVYGLLPSTTPAPAHLLWNHLSDGEASLWTENPQTGSYTHREYGPFAGWVPTAMADGPDGHTHLLWYQATGEISLWNVAPDGSYTAREYGPYTSWSAPSISVGPDNTVHVIWNHDYKMSLWRVAADGSFTHQEYGPFPNWEAVAVADGPDNYTRILWVNTGSGPDTQLSLWWIAPDGSYTNQQYGPYTGWGANAIAVGPDNLTHIFWFKKGGAGSLWSVNGTGNAQHREYGPYPGWMARSIAVGSDNVPRLLWDNDSTESLWSVNSADGFTQTTEGPFPGWQAVAVSAAP